MKKILFLFLSVIFSCAAMAQSQDDTVTVYCQIMGENTNFFGLGTKCKVKVDFGQGEGLWSSEGNKLVDANGKDIKFESMIDALNYMSDHGWEYVDNMFFTKGSGNVIHYLLKKEVPASELNTAMPATKDSTKAGKKTSSDTDKYRDDIY